MRKELPIVVEGNYIKTECWAFERLSIIQTSEKADAWVSSHFELFLDSQYKARFGSLFKWYHSHYYDDILLTKKIDFMKIEKEKIVDRIKEILNEDMYVFIVSNWYMESADNPFFHGMIIYGYDDKEESFFAPTMNKSKVWVRSEVPYKEIEEAHESVIEHFSKNNNRLTFSIDFQYPMLAYKIREDYSTEQCVYFALEKIENEINGRVCWNSLIDKEVHCGSMDVFYTGIACLLGLEKLVNIFIQDRDYENVYDLTNTLSQMYEHRNMILVSMNYICQQWDIADDSVIDCIDRYKKNCDDFYSWYHMAVKYEICKDKTLLYEILENIHKEYESEKDTLRDFSEIVRRLYEKSNY